MQSQLCSIRSLVCYRAAGRHKVWLLQQDAGQAFFGLRYASASSGSRPSSILSDDVSPESVFGKHLVAAQHFEEALRDSVAERLTTALGRRKGRHLDLDSLQRLPATELIEACHQAHLTIAPKEDPHLLATALHQWLHAPEAAEATAVWQPRRGPTGTATPTGNWDHPGSLRHSNWLRQSLFKRNADTGSTDSITHAAGRATSDAGTSSPLGRFLPAVEGGNCNTGGPAAAEAAAARDAAAETALRAEAERQAEVLFDEELQRRLQQAAATSAAAMKALPVLPNAASGGLRLAGSDVSSAAVVNAGGSVTGSTQSKKILELDPQQQQVQMQLLQPQSLPSSPSLPPPPLQPQPQPQPHVDHKVQQQARKQQVIDHSAASSHDIPILSTTELLAASQSGAISHQATSSSRLLYRMNGGTVDDGSLFDSPPPSMGPPPPSEVVAAVRRSLVRGGYSSKDPTALHSLLLLSRGELLRLVESFNGDGLDTAGQSREQLAVRLRDMMRINTCASDGGAPFSSNGVRGSGIEGARTVEGEGELARSAAGVGPESPPESRVEALGGDRRRVVTWLRQELRVGDGNGEGREVEDVWDDERAALGDARRRQVLEAARRRQQLMAAAAQPEEIATWLVKARAQDVVVISSDPDQYLEDGGSALHRSFTTGSGSRGCVSYMVIATGLSQRHAFACAEAVRYQIRERLEELASEETRSVSGSEIVASKGASPLDTAVRAAPSVSGFNGADWLSLEAGRVQVHVLTPQARRYYRLEDLLGAESRGSRRDPARGMRARYRGDVDAAGSKNGGADHTRIEDLRPPLRPRVRLFGPLVAGERVPDTLETARVDTVAEH